MLGYLLTPAVPPVLLEEDFWGWLGTGLPDFIATSGIVEPDGRSIRASLELGERGPAHYEP